MPLTSWINTWRVELGQEDSIIFVCGIISYLLWKKWNGSWWWLIFLFVWQIEAQYIRVRDIPAVWNRGDAMSKDLIIKLQDSYHLDHTSWIESSLIIVGNIDICWKSNSNGNSFLWNNTSSRDTTLSRSDLYNLVE